MRNLEDNSPSAATECSSYSFGFGQRLGGRAGFDMSLIELRQSLQARRLSTPIVQESRQATAVSRGCLWAEAGRLF